jgi:hypothetical protein
MLHVAVGYRTRGNYGVPPLAPRQIADARPGWYRARHDDDRDHVPNDQNRAEGDRD